MRELIQIIAVLAIALGAGLYGFGRHVDPPFSLANPVAVTRVNEHTRGVAATATGWGIGFITLGVLSLAVPWVNICVSKQHERSGAGPP